MAYTTNRTVPGYVSFGEVRNGVSARGQVLENIANNQQWLAVTDCDMHTVYMGEMTDRTFKLHVRLNPYALWVEFFLLCLKDIDGASTTPAGLLIGGSSSADEAQTYEIPAGEDFTATGGTRSNGAFEWVRFTGRVDDSTVVAGPRAVLGDTAPDANYRWVEFSVTIDPEVYVKTIQFRVLPALSPIAVP